MAEQNAAKWPHEKPACKDEKSLHDLRDGIGGREEVVSDVRREEGKHAKVVPLENIARDARKGDHAQRLAGLLRRSRERRALPLHRRSRLPLHRRSRERSTLLLHMGAEEVSEGCRDAPADMCASVRGRA